MDFASSVPRNLPALDQRPALLLAGFSEKIPKNVCGKLKLILSLNLVLLVLKSSNHYLTISMSLDRASMLF